MLKNRGNTTPKIVTKDATNFQSTPLIIDIATSLVSCVTMNNKIQSISQKRRPTPTKRPHVSIWWGRVKLMITQNKYVGCPYILILRFTLLKTQVKKLKNLIS